MTLSPPVYHAPSSEAESLRDAYHSGKEITVELEGGKKVTGRVTFFSEDGHGIRATMSIPGFPTGAIIIIHKTQAA